MPKHLRPHMHGKLFFCHAKGLDALTTMSPCRSPRCHVSMASLQVTRPNCAVRQCQRPHASLQLSQQRPYSQIRSLHAVSPFISVHKRSAARARIRPIVQCSAASAQAETRGSKIRLIQHKEEAFWFYRFLSIVYDTIVNPGHWTEDMRTDALSVAELQDPNLKVG